MNGHLKLEFFFEKWSKNAKKWQNLFMDLNCIKMSSFSIFCSYLSFKDKNKFKLESTFKNVQSFFIMRACSFALLF